MGLFDFLKPKAPKPSKAEFAKVRVMFMFGEKSKHVQNLKAIGRNIDARTDAESFIDEILAAYAQDPDDLSLLKLMARFALNVGETAKAAVILVNVTNRPEIRDRIDLTAIFWYLAHIVYISDHDPARALEYFQKATTATPPAGCKQPATSKDKANAHTMAMIMAEKTHDEEAYVFHDQSRRKVLPDIDWDDPRVLFELKQGSM
jgi:hypothetical protein